MQELKEEEFDEKVLKSDKFIILDFGAVWCPPCKKQLPILEKFSEEFDGEIYSVDIDKCPNIAKNFSIKSVPTLILFKGGVQVNFKLGLTSLEKLRDFVK